MGNKPDGAWIIIITVIQFQPWAHATIANSYWVSNTTLLLSSALCFTLEAYIKVCTQKSQSLTPTNPSVTQELLAHAKPTVMLSLWCGFAAHLRSLFQFMWKWESFQEKKRKETVTTISPCSNTKGCWMAVIRCRKPTDTKAKPFDKSLLYILTGEESSKPQHRAEMQKKWLQRRFCVHFNALYNYIQSYQLQRKEFTCRWTRYQNISQRSFCYDMNRRSVTSITPLYHNCV